MTGPLWLRLQAITICGGSPHFALCGRLMSLHLQPRPVCNASWVAETYTDEGQGWMGTGGSHNVQGNRITLVGEMGLRQCYS